MVATTAFQRVSQGLLNLLRLSNGRKAEIRNTKNDYSNFSLQGFGWKTNHSIPSMHGFGYGKLTGATRVIDFTDFEYFAAKAIAMMQPMECATMCKESN